MSLQGLNGAKCLVLGAGGFIGSNLCELLSLHGAVVTGFGRNVRFPEAKPARWITGRSRDAAVLATAASGADFVFHLLGNADPGASNADPLAELNDVSANSLAVLEVCRGVRAKRLVILSSGGTVYRPGLPVPIAEDAPTDPISAYGIGKLVLEKYAALFRHLYGLNSVVLRIANPFGPFQDPDRSQGFIAKLMKRGLAGQPVELWGDGSAVRDFLFVRDVAEAIALAAISDTPSEVFNIGSGVGRSLSDVIADVGDVLGRPIAINQAPARSADTPTSILDISRAVGELGWQPRTSWQEGLQRTRAWIAARYEH